MFKTDTRDSRYKNEIDPHSGEEQTVWKVQLLEFLLDSPLQTEHLSDLRFSRRISELGGHEQLDRSGLGCHSQINLFGECCPTKSTDNDLDVFERGRESRRVIVINNNKLGAFGDPVSVSGSDILNRTTFMFAS